MRFTFSLSTLLIAGLSSVLAAPIDTMQPRSIMKRDHYCSTAEGGIGQGIDVPSDSDIAYACAFATKFGQGQWLGQGYQNAIHYSPNFGGTPVTITWSAQIGGFWLTNDICVHELTWLTQNCQFSNMSGGKEFRGGWTQTLDGNFQTMVQAQDCGQFPNSCF